MSVWPIAGGSLFRMPVRARRTLAVLAAIAVVGSGCAGNGAATGGPVEQGVDLAVARAARLSGSPDQARGVGAAIDAFGLALFRQAAVRDENAVVSPASVALALAMARAGARGATATEMDGVLHGAGADANAPGLAALDAALGGVSGTFRDVNGDDHRVTLRIANAAFAQRGMPLEQPFLEALAARFGTGLHLVDYRANTEAARGLINAWVGDATEKRIPELIARGVLDSLTRLTLVNAIYLKAPWERPFYPDATKTEPFSRAEGTPVDVPMMHGAPIAGYAAGAGWKAVDLRYAGGSLAMSIVVPDDLAAFEAGLDGALLAQIVGSFESREVDVALPRFKLETKLDLTAVLPKMGMPLAFDQQRADFTGITTSEPLYISAVVHQANIDVDEKGTEAAAATAVAIAASAMPEAPPQVHADRPFLFVLRETSTGTVLFLGQVTDPTKA